MGLTEALLHTGVRSVYAWLVRRRRRRVEPDPWTTAARTCHLIPVAMDFSTWVSGHEGPDHDLRVRFEKWVEEGDQRGTLILVEALDRGIVTLSLLPETASTERAKQRGAREIETGDDGFDDEFYVTGPAPTVRAVLDEETRGFLRRLRPEVGLEVVHGEVRGRVRYAPFDLGLHGPALSRTLPVLFEAARRLRRPTDTSARLAHNATADREPGIRRENLLALIREYPDSETTRETLRAAVCDAIDAVRVRAAIALGEEGLPTLLDVARHGDGDDLAAARAIAALGDRLAAEDAKAILGRALRCRRVEIARECVASLGRRAEADVISVIAKVLAVESGELAVAAVQALAVTGLALAEAPLLSALARDAPELRVAAASALGRVGSAGAVLPLKEIETRYRDDATRRAARQAVAAIQSRLPGASPGQLSLAAADAGALSLTEDETGRLSLDEARKR